MENDFFNLVLVHHRNRQGYFLAGVGCGGVETSRGEDRRDRDRSVCRGRFLADGRRKGRGQVFTGLVVAPDAATQDTVANDGSVVTGKLTLGPKEALFLTSIPAVH